MNIFEILKIWFRFGYSFSYIIDAVTKRQLKFRVGECNYCGKCCLSCKYLEQNDGPVKMCTIYNHRHCNKSFPISQEDLDYYKDIEGFSCNYKFIFKIN